MKQLLNRYTHRHHFLLLTISCFSIFTLSLQLHASNENSKYLLEFSDDQRITVVASDVPLDSVLKDIQRQTGLNLAIPKDRADQRISVDIRSLPLEDALKRMLRGISYVCLSRSGNQIDEVIIFSTVDRDGDSSGDGVDERVPVDIGERYINLYTIEDMKSEIDIRPPPQLEDMETAMVIESPPETQDIEFEMGIVSSPEIEDMETAMAIESSPENEDIEFEMSVASPTGN